MAYQLKSTGIAANCTICIAVDPDTSTVKDFASAAVTADILVGATVTIGEQAWDGITRKYWRPGAGTADADFVKFGTSKPSWTFNAGHQRTIVFIGEVAGPTARVVGKNSGAYFASNSIASGGATTPTIVLGGTSSGTGAALVSGNKRILGFTMEHGVSTTAWRAADTDSAMTSESVTTQSPSGSSFNWDWQYVNRRDDSGAHQQDKTHAILVFNTVLTEAQWDSLRDDWFGTLLEVAGGAAPVVTAHPANASVTEPATANFTATATDSTSLQWQYSTDGGTTPLNVIDGTGGTTGTTSGSYTTGATAVASGNHRNGYVYRCGFTNATGTTYTNWATLTVNAPGGGGQAVRTMHQTFMRAQ